MGGLSLDIRALDRRGYRESLSHQERLVAARLSGDIGDQLLLTEHDPVVTVGRGGDLDQLRVGEARLTAEGIGLYQVDRGGGATYHGPGQLVVYPIIDLGQRRDLHSYLRGLEEVVIKALADFGLRGQRVRGSTGVWCGGGKIASIGIRVRRWVTSHGFSINVTDQSAPFKMIRPCGLDGVEATDIERLCERPPGMDIVVKAVADRFAEVFEYDNVSFIAPRVAAGQS